MTGDASRRRDLNRHELETALAHMEQATKALRRALSGAGLKPKHRAPRVAAQASATAQASSMRPRQAAEFLGIGESTFWKWAKVRPDFPKPIKIGPRTTVFPLDQLTAWRDAQ